MNRCQMLSTDSKLNSEQLLGHIYMIHLNINTFKGDFAIFQRTHFQDIPNSN